MMPPTNISPFDVAAETYDEDFTQSKIGRMQRQIVWRMLTPLLQSYGRPLNILEINCGTGEDALQLAQLGHHVIATDASLQMIQQAKQKACHSESPNKPDFIRCRFDQLATVDLNERFDLVISNFGGLNCIDEKEMSKLSEVLCNLVTEDGKLLLVVLSRFCLWEIIYYSLKGRFSTAFRRFKPSVAFKVDKHRMDIYYYSPLHLLKLFKPLFSCLQLKPVGLLIPPSYLESAFTKRPGWLRSLNRWERKLAFPAFSFLADHYCVILEKNKS
jgi:ubiquinone/menaquinone biosynthesis C-methylase UbiE